MNRVWRTAPNWAMWLAQDKTGEWFWYAERPKWSGKVWASGGRVAPAYIPALGAVDSLEARP